MDGMSTPEMPEFPATPAAVAPPHPYAPQPPTGNGGGSGKGLSIAAMAMGLAALLTTVVAAFYSGNFVVVGVLLAFAAIVLGIIALVKKQRPIAPGIVGLSSGALTLVVALVVGAFALGSVLMPAAQLAAGGNSGSNGETGGSDENPHDDSEIAPSTPAGAVGWPANMATGGIAFMGTGSDIHTVRSAPLEDNAMPVPAELSEMNEGNATDRIQLYVDYRCPYCAQFEEVSGETLEDALETGTTVLELHPLTFLDRASQGSYYSSRVAGAMACVADVQPASAWDAHTALMDTDFQPAEGTPGPDNAAIIAELDDATDGLMADARACIESEQFVPFAQALSDWVFANPVPHADDPALTVTGTPFAVVNGVPYAGDPADGAAFRAFVEEQGIKLR